MAKCLYKNRLGKRGEEIARKYLIDNGLRYVRSNYRFERSEIDLIFKDEDKNLLIFVEVKTRRNKNFGEPEESVTALKQEHIRKVVYGFVSENPEYESFDLRIDVVTIMVTPQEETINHIENAF